MTVRHIPLFIAVFVLFTAPALAQSDPAPSEKTNVTHTPIRYTLDGTTFHSHLYLPADVEEPVPGVVVYPEWWGVNDYAKHRGQMLAGLGYAALVVDLYGAGKVTEDPRQAGQWAGTLRNDHALWRQRAAAGFTRLRDHEQVRGDALAAIGYCFGGTTALQLAYTDPDGLKGVVSFHGNLTPPAEDDTITASIFIAHGAADDFVPPEQVNAWQQAMAQREVDYIFTAYAGAVHSFTNPDADDHGIDGVAYDKKADQRAWAHMRMFFGELFDQAVAIEAANAAGDAEPVPPVTIDLAVDGALRVDGVATTREDLPEALAAMSPDAELRMRVDRRTPMRHVVDLMEVIQTVNAKQPVLSVHEAGVPAVLE